jgi:SET domain-containing protein
MLTYQNGYVGAAGKKGRGVFAKKGLRRGEIIEISPYIEVPPRDDRRLSDSIIESYWYEVRGKWSAIGLGYTSLYNHSKEPNADFSINAKRRTITIKATKTITRDEEITINYGYELGN